MAEPEDDDRVYFIWAGDRSTDKFHDRSEHLFIYYRQCDRTAKVVWG